MSRTVLAGLCVVAVLAAEALGAPALAQGGAPPSSVPAAQALEAAGALPLTRFYDAPADLKASKAGQLLRKATAFGYSLPKGTQAIRILYHSKDASGGDVASSAVVLIPAGPAPAGGWPVIAWAHGTSGVARQCAPSLMKDVYYGDEGLDQMLAAGFAVVAPDYHGLGTAGPHQYMDTWAQANDVVFAVPAARQAAPALGARWVVDGHSQGGQAAWGVAEREAALKQPDYLGAVSVAGATHLSWMIDQPVLENRAGFYLAWLAYAVHARYPQFRPEDILSAKALARYSAATTSGCWYSGYARFFDMTGAQMVRPGWNRNPWLRRFVQETQVGSVRLNRPLLDLAGEADRAVPLAGVKATLRRACAVGDPVVFKSYPGLDHDPVMMASTPDQLRWIRARFDGAPVTSNCATAVQATPGG